MGKNGRENSLCALWVDGHSFTLLGLGRDPSVVVDQGRGGVVEPGRLETDSDRRAPGCLGGSGPDPSNGSSRSWVSGGARDAEKF